MLENYYNFHNETSYFDEKVEDDDDDDDDWSPRSNLFHLPSLNSYLSGEKKKQDEKYRMIRFNTQLKLKRERDELLRKLDNKLNLNWHLQSNPKYLSIGKRKQSTMSGGNQKEASTNSVLGPVLMSRIVIEASKYFRMREKLEQNSGNSIYLLNNYVFNNPELDLNGNRRRKEAIMRTNSLGINLGFKRSIENYCSTNRLSCVRFKRNLSRFESKELMQSMLKLQPQQQQQESLKSTLTTIERNNNNNNNPKISFKLLPQIEKVKTERVKVHSHSLPMTAQSTTRPTTKNVRPRTEQQQHQQYLSFASSVNNKLKLFEQFQFQQQQQQKVENNKLSTTNDKKKKKIFI